MSPGSARPPLPIADVPDARREHLFHPERVAVDVADPLDWPGVAPVHPACAWHLASLCHAVYHGADAAMAAARALGWETAARIERDGLRLDLLRRDGLQLLVGCGTRPEELHNLRQDVDAVPIPHPLGGRVHRGFLEAWNALETVVRARLDERPLVLAGHSLGGALALLAAAALPNLAAVAFGCPRVGDAGFAPAMAGRRIWRYQCVTDVVGHLPPSDLGFRHLGRLVLLTTGGGCRIDPRPAVLRRDQARARLRYALHLPWLRPGALWWRELADHAIHGYCQRLLRLARAGAGTEAAAARGR